MSNNNLETYIDQDHQVAIAIYDGYFSLAEFKVRNEEEFASLSQSPNPHIHLLFIKNLKVLSKEIQAWVNFRLVSTRNCHGTKILRVCRPCEFDCFDEHKICE